MSPATHTNQPAPVRLVAEAARRVARSMRDLTSYEEQVIDHRSWRGDDWAFTVAVDFDQDSRKDILFGDYWGRVWFHRNTSPGGSYGHRPESQCGLRR